MRNRFLLVMALALSACGSPAELEQVGESAQPLVTRTHLYAPITDYTLPCNDWQCSNDTLTHSTNIWHTTSTFVNPFFDQSDHVVGAYMGKPSVSECNNMQSIQQVWFDFMISVGPQAGQVFTIWGWPDPDLQAPFRDCALNLGPNLTNVELDCYQGDNLLTGQPWTKRDIGCNGGGAVIEAFSFFRSPNPNLVADKVYDMRLRVISSDTF